MRIISWNVNGLRACAREAFPRFLRDCGADVIGTYQEDFYAGTAAVTRHQFGAGQGWYVGAGLDQRGVSWVIRRVLDRHDLTGPYAHEPGLETAVRVTPGGHRVLFLLHHGDTVVEVAASVDGEELLTGERIVRGQALRLGPRDVRVIREDPR